MLGPTEGRQLRRWWTSVGIQLVAAGVAAAAPFERRQNDHQEQSSDSNRDNSNQNLGSSISPQVWVPAVVVVLVLLGAFCFVWTRTNIVSRLRGAASRAVRPSNTSNATREVTASQLTGGASIGRRAGAGTTRINPRTGRRNRRTPSQMSTTSLPVYMKEPGDHELVIFRGPEEMDASNAIAEAREAEDQDDERDSASIQRRDSRASVLVLDAGPGPDPDPDQSAMSLGLMSVESNPEPDTSTAELLPRRHRPSDSHDTSDSRSLLVRRVSDVPSEAPPDYDFETQQRNSTSTAIIDPPGLTDPGPASTESDPPPSPPPPPPAQPAMPESAQGARRRSRLASRVSNLLHLRNGSNATNADAAVPEEFETPRVSDAAAEPAPNAGVSAISLNDPSPPSRPPVAQRQQHARHRHSQSGGSSSTLNLALPFRTLSRQRSSNTLARQRSNNTLNSNGNASRSNVNLTSPSALSLSLAAGAISAPLSHTLVRTEIRYPAGGPTPEQVRLLSARDGFGRFGVPYGADAVAHAQSSRQELALDPPPVFESSSTEDGPSAARESGESADRQNNDDDDNDGDDPDALPAELSADVPPSSRNRSTESVAAVEPTRILVPLFM